MQRKTVSTFTDASKFARKCAQQTGTVVKVQREGSHWTVLDAPGNFSQAKDGFGQRSYVPKRLQKQPQNGWLERQIEEQNSRGDRKKKLWELA
jgi:hypothetical protein